jgi:hypothetical protein
MLEERVKTVFVVVTVIVNRPVGLGARVTVGLKEFVVHGVAVELYEGAVNVADPVTEFLNVADVELDGRRDIEIRAVNVKGEAEDVFDGGIVFVCVTDDLEVLEPAMVLLDVIVLKRFVGEARGLEEVVLDELILAVVVVEDVVVFVLVIVLETVGDADVVLELLDVTVLVTVLKLLRLTLGLAVPLGVPVDVFEGAIERVTVVELELVFEGGCDLDIVGELVLVLDVLTLAVDVFVGGYVLDNLEEEVVVRVGAIVREVAGEDVGVFEGIVVFVFGNVGGIVNVAKELIVGGRVPSELNVLREERVDVFDDVADDVKSA